MSGSQWWFTPFPGIKPYTALSFQAYGNVQYITVLLPVVLYGCETWSVTLRKNTDWGWLRTVVEGNNWALQNVTGGYRKLQIEELQIIRRVGKIAKKTVSFVKSICQSVRMQQRGSFWANFYEVLYLSIFRKSVTKIQVSLKSNKNMGTLHEDQ